MNGFGPNDFERRQVSTEPQSFTPIPDGHYRATVTSGSIVKHPEGDEQWELEFTVKQDPYMGRKVWTKYRINAADAQKAQWDKNSLGQVFDSLGFRHHLQHPSQMVSPNTEVKVTIRQFASKSDPSKIYNFVKFCNPIAPAAHAQAVQTATSAIPGGVVQQSAPVAPSTQEIPW